MTLLSVNKSVLQISLVTLFVTLQMMFGVVCGDLIPSKTRVTITNKMTVPMTIHCKDKHNDDGVYTLQPGESHRFQFYPNPFFRRSLWFCSFQWTGAFHHFDIYDQKRNECDYHKCFWEIREPGVPCRINYNDDVFCYPWNDNHNNATLEALKDSEVNNTLR
ncbi:putative plant self-incompatibility S1 [Lupinus albus]|uniref:S-protein homolog n=1 Tax=Lupinus albus TaxID=3870 RepID=A0A6A4QGF0_LUPAL|nr:putative plant self-incompatibility S1 [Lupinus albus]